MWLRLEGILTLPYNHVTLTFKSSYCLSQFMTKRLWVLKACIWWGPVLVQSLLIFYLPPLFWCSKIWCEVRSLSAIFQSYLLKFLLMILVCLTFFINSYARNSVPHIRERYIILLYCYYDWYYEKVVSYHHME